MPLRLFNADGEIAWEAHYTAFGVIDRKGAYQTEQPLRLQGQYYYEESGLYYDGQSGLFKG